MHRSVALTAVALMLLIPAIPAVPAEDPIPDQRIPNICEISDPLCLMFCGDCLPPACNTSDLEACLSAYCSYVTKVPCSVSLPCDSVGDCVETVCPSRECLSACDDTLGCLIPACAQDLCSVPEQPCNTLGECIDVTCGLFTPSPCAMPPVEGFVIGQGVVVDTPEVIETEPVVTLPPVWTPELDPIVAHVPQVVTDPIPVPEHCTYFGLICVGPYTVPSQSVGPYEEEVFPGLRPIPIVRNPTDVPPGTEVALPTGATMAVGFSDVQFSVAPRIGQYETIGPIDLTVETPFGDIPVTLCASTCPVPVAPGASVYTTVGVHIAVGDESYTYLKDVEIVV